MRSLSPLEKERIATLAIFITNGFGMGAWAAAVPRIAAQHHLTDSALGVALFTFAIGAIVAMPLAGRLAPWLGSGKSTAALAVAFVLALSLPPLAHGYLWLCLALITLGACNGALDVSMNGHASAIESALKTPIMSSFHAAWSAGALLGAGAGGLIQAKGGGELAGLLLPAVVGAAATAIAMLLGLRDVGPRPTYSSAGLSLPDAHVRKLAGLAFLAMLVEGAIADWSAVFLRGEFAGLPSRAVIGYTFFAATMTACRLIGDRFVKRFGAKTTVSAGGIIAAIGLACCLARPSVLSASLGFALAGIGLANIVPVIFSAAGKATSNPATGVSMAATAGYAGFLIGPPFIGFTAGQTGLRIALFIPVAALLIITVVGRTAVGRVQQAT